MSYRYFLSSFISATAALFLSADFCGLMDLDGPVFPFFFVPAAAAALLWSGGKLGGLAGCKENIDIDRAAVATLLD